MTDQLLTDLIVLVNQLQTDFQTFRSEYVISVQWIVGLLVAIFAVLLLMVLSQFMSQYKG